MSWYKDGFFWRKASPPWEVKNYSEVINGKGDLISNSMMRIIEQEDRSDWAFSSFLYCGDLLLAGKRWPDRMSQSIDAKNCIQWRWSQLWQQNFDSKNRLRRAWSKFTRFFGLKNTTVLYRPQHQQTRDPWIYFFGCAIHLNRKQFIKSKPPLKLYSPEVWAWRRALLGKRNCYKFYRRITPGRRDFVKALDDLMWNAYKQNREK